MEEKLLNEDSLKESCLLCLKNMFKDENGKIYYSEDIQNIKVKEKIDNLLSILNSLSSEEYEEFLDRDFENDIFYII